MSNLKINDKKIKEALKKCVVLTTIVSTLVMIPACDKDIKTDDISYTNEEKEAYVKTVVINDRLTNLYRGQNLMLAIDKETYEVKKYVLHNEDIYDKTSYLEKGYIMAAGFIITYPNDYNVFSTKIILDDYYIVKFVDINDYVEGHKLKDYYTLEEIEGLQSILIKSIKKTNEFEKNNQKIKNKV